MITTSYSQDDFLLVLSSIFYDYPRAQLDCFQQYKGLGSFLTESENYLNGTRLGKEKKNLLENQ